jgi:hypothetical protein
MYSRRVALSRFFFHRLFRARAACAGEQYRRMQRIMVYNAPSRIEFLEQEAKHRNHHGAFEVPS